MDEFLQELKDAMVEYDFTARWARVEGYHVIGAMILEQGNKYGQNIVGRISKHIGKSDRTVRYAVDLARKYPNLDDLPEGKALSWGRICRRYLDGKEDEPKKPKIIKCPNCGHEWEK